MGFPFLPRSAA